MSRATCRHDLDPATCSVCNGVDILQGRMPAPGRQSNIDELVDAIFQWIPDETEDPISREDLAYNAGIEPAQVSRAIAWLRDTSPDLPLVSSRAGYQWSLDEAAVNAYRAARTKTALTTMRRTYTGVLRPYLEQTQDADTVRRLNRAYERLLEDIGDLVP